MPAKVISASDFMVNCLFSNSVRLDLWALSRILLRNMDIDIPPRKIALPRPVPGKEELDAVRDVLDSSWLSQGPKVAEFEAVFARRIKMPQAVAVPVLLNRGVRECK